MLSEGVAVCYMKRLIVNADDFGLHTEINKGIIKGHKEGFITSTSLMPSAPAFEEAVDLAKECPKLGIGIHLTLVGGVRTCASSDKVSSLIDSNGLFLDNYIAFSKRYYTGGVKKYELELELRSQIEKALGTGLKITHIDSHQHTHVLPGVNNIVIKLCEEYGIKKLRVPQEPYTFNGGFTTGIGRLVGRAGLSFCAQILAAKLDNSYKYPDCFFGMLAGGNLNEQLVANILKALPEGASEIMTHPGLSNKILGNVFPWNYHWEQELGAYLSKNNHRLLEEYKIKLINFGEL